MSDHHLLVVSFFSWRCHCRPRPLAVRSGLGNVVLTVVGLSPSIDCSASSSSLPLRAAWYFCRIAALEFFQSSLGGLFSHFCFALPLLRAAPNDLPLYNCSSSGGSSSLPRAEAERLGGGNCSTDFMYTLRPPLRTGDSARAAVEGLGPGLVPRPG